MQARGGVDIPAGLDEEVSAQAVLNIALDAVNADAPAPGVIKGAAFFERDAGDQIEGAEIPEGRRRTVPVAPVTVKVAAGAGRRLQPELPVFPIGRVQRHEIDHAARGADALDGVGAEQDLDPLDDRRVDGKAVPIPVAQRIGLRHAVDQIKRRAPAPSAPKFCPVFNRKTKPGIA